MRPTGQSRAGPSWQPRALAHPERAPGVEPLPPVAGAQRETVLVAQGAPRGSQ
jgi:hypothetical protein